MANINDALGAFALGTLSKAAGQDFLTPMLQDVRQKDMFAFQRKQLEEAQAKERQRRQEESAASKKGLLNAYMAAGAMTAEDVAAAGGPDLLARMEDGEFQMALSSFSDRRAQALADSDLFAAVRGMAAASNVALPEGGIKTRDQALELKARIEYQRINEQMTKETRNEEARTLAEFLQTVDSNIGQMLTGDPLAVDTTALDASRQMVAQALGKVANTELDKTTASLFTQTLNGTMVRINQQQARATANEYARSRQGAQLLTDLSTLPDESTRAQVMAHPRVTPVVETMRQNFALLKRIGSEAQAADAGVLEAWQAAQGFTTVEEAMDDPAAARTIFAAPAGAADAKLQDNQAFQAASAQAQEVVNDAAIGLNYGGAFGAAAQAVIGADIKAFVEGRAGQYVVKTGAVADLMAQAILPRLGQMDPGELTRFRTDLLAFAGGSPLGKELNMRIFPALRQAEDALFRSLDPEDIDFGALTQINGLDAIAEAQGQLLVQMDKGKTAINETALDKLVFGSTTYLSGSLRAGETAVRGAGERLKQVEQFVKDNPDLHASFELASREFNEDEAEYERLRVANDEVASVIKPIYDGLLSGSRDKSDIAQDVAAAITAALGRTYQTAGLDTATELTADAILSKISGGKTMAQAALEVLEEQSAGVARQMEASTRGRGEAESLFKVALDDWRTVYQRLLPEGADVEGLDKALSKRFLRGRSIQGIDPRDVLLAIVASRGDF